MVDTIDNELTNDNIADSSADVTPLANGSDTTQDAGADHDVDASSGDGSDTTQVQNDERSLTSDKDTQDGNWRKRYEGQTLSYNKLRREYETDRRRLQDFHGVDPAQVRAYNEAQAKAKDADLPKWHPKNPQAPHFQETKSAWTRFRTAYNNEQDQSVREVLRSKLDTMFSPEDQAELRKWEDHKASFSESFAADPESSMEQVFEKMFTRKMAEERSETEAKSSVGDWFSKNSDVVKDPEDASYMEQQLLSGKTWEVASELTQLRHENRIMRGQLSGAERAQASAQAKDSLLKGNASVTRDRAVSTSISKNDLYNKAQEVARSQGIKGNDPRFMTIVSDLAAEYAVK